MFCLAIAASAGLGVSFGDILVSTNVGEVKKLVSGYGSSSEIFRMLLRGFVRSREEGVGVTIH